MCIFTQNGKTFPPYRTTLFPKVGLNGKSRFKEKGIRGSILVFFLTLPTYPSFLFYRFNFLLFSSQTKSLCLHSFIYFFHNFHSYSYAFFRIFLAHQKRILDRISGFNIICIHKSHVLNKFT